MKKAFKLFGFIALSMTLAVACGNANNTPAEEEAVVEEQATEVVEEAQVEAPAQQVAPAVEEEKEEPAETIAKEAKGKVEGKGNIGNLRTAEDAQKQKEMIDEAKEKTDAKSKGKKGTLKVSE